MTSRQIIRPGDTDDVPAHQHDGSEISGNATFLKLRASALTAGTITGQLLQSDYLTLVAQNDTDEGGEIAMLGAASFADWFVDVFEDVWRVRVGANVRLQVNDDGTVAIITGPLVFPSTADGSAASPAIRRNDTADGFFFGSGFVAATIGTSEVLRVTGTAGKNLQGLAWTTWSPTLANLNVGTTGTTVARYVQIGETVFFDIHVTLGGTGISVGDCTFTVPVAENAEYNNGGDDRVKIGDATLIDAATGIFDGVVTIDDGVLRPRVLSTAGSHTAQASISSTVPMTWAAGDRMWLHGWYEIA